MDKTLTVYKPLGLTPLELLDDLRVKNPELKNEKLSYAGRLDPMAEGLLLVLVGEANKRREEYLGLDKKYEFELLFGVATDSFDCLGLVEAFEVDIDREMIRSQLDVVLASFLGKQLQSYPAYSSKTVEGKPLWLWAKEGRIDEIVLPEHEVEVYDLQLNEFEEISSEELRLELINRIAKVSGGFRQNAILDSWNSKISAPKARKNLSFMLARCSIHCSSGFYIRQLAADIGQQLAIPTLAWSIKRTELGEMKLDS